MVRIGKGKGAHSQSEQVTSAAAPGRARAGGQDPKSWLRLRDAAGSRAWLSHEANSSALPSQQVAKGAGQGQCLPRASAQAQVKEEEEGGEGEEKNQTFAEPVGLSFSTEAEGEEKNETFAESVGLSYSTTTPGEESEGSEGDWGSHISVADASGTEFQCSPRWVGELGGVPNCCGQAGGRDDDERHGVVIKQQRKVVGVPGMGQDGAKPGRGQDDATEVGVPGMDQDGAKPGMGQDDATEVKGLLARFSLKLPGAMELPRPPDGGRRSAMVEGIEQASLPRPPETGHFAQHDGGMAWQCGNTAAHEDQLQEIIAKASALPAELQVQFREGLHRLSARK